MYEDQTYENILDRSLARVASDVDKREGSVIMNAIAPVSAEHADVYIQLGNIVNNGYADTAVREFLILRCKERGIIPYEATKATLKGKFNMEIPIGSRFNLNELNYVATAFIESADGYFYYQMECETEGTNTEHIYPGTIPNSVFSMFELKDYDFVDEYNVKDNSHERIKWKLDFYHRLFNVERRKEALEAAKDESEKLKKMITDLRD